MISKSKFKSFCDSTLWFSFFSYEDKDIDKDEDEVLSSIILLLFSSIFIFFEFFSSNFSFDKIKDFSKFKFLRLLSKSLFKLDVSSKISFGFLFSIIFFSVFLFLLLFSFLLISISIFFSFNSFIFSLLLILLSKSLVLSILYIIYYI